MLHAPNRRTPMPETPHLARRGVIALAALCAFAVLPASGGEKVLYAFQGHANDGQTPNGALISDIAGNLYGVTAGGGEDQPGCCGTVFKLAPDGSETVLYAFQSGSDGTDPNGILAKDNAGNLYGTASGGGGVCQPNVCGAVFRLAPDGTETILHAFTGGSDGETPQGGVIADASGNLYGTAEAGGDLSDCNEAGCGTVFKVAPDGTVTVLHAFQGSDGWQPRGTLMMDGSGNLYGTTAMGGNMEDCAGNGCGTVFEVSPDGTETVLYAFKGSDGETPLGGVIADSAGNLYGTTLYGGASNVGTVFKLAPNGAESVLHSFQMSGVDGAEPEAGLIMDNRGDLYGTTFDGGSGCRDGCGTAFKLTPGSIETILYAFGQKHGSRPTAALLAGKNGLLYGTTPDGGAKQRGVVFSVKE
jgi:uncharacterized repeat protein (TIGR03803 family)